VPPSPPAENATTRQDQAGKSRMQAAIVVPGGVER